MEDPKKVDKILAMLNKGLVKDKWVWEQAEGFHALMVAIPPQNSLSPAYFNGSNGVIVKTFVNVETGEMKTFFYKKVIQ